MAKKMSQGAKVGIGIGIAAAIGLGIYLATKPAAASTSTSPPKTGGGPPRIPGSIGPAIPGPSGHLFVPPSAVQNQTLNNGQTYKFIIEIDSSVDPASLPAKFANAGMQQADINGLPPTFFGTFVWGTFSGPLPVIPGVTWVSVQ